MLPSLSYKYKLDSDVTLKLHFIGCRVSHQYFDLYEDGKLIVRQGYAWDGMTWYPDFVSTYYPSLAHDVLYQIIKLSLLEIDYKKYADIELFVQLIKHNHPIFLSNIVMGGVLILGRFWIKR
jgi:hypothetical protein